MRYRRKPDVRFRIVADEAVVVRQRDAEVLVLNEVGGRILELIDENFDRDQIARQVGEEFDAPEAEISSHVDDFLDQLTQAGVIELASEDD